MKVYTPCGFYPDKGLDVAVVVAWIVVPKSSDSLGEVAMPPRLGSG
jgi:hypothetical protein